MFVDISVNLNDKAVERYLTDLERSQIPFATAQAMNQTMIEAQTAVRKEYDRVFEERNKSLARALTTIPRREFATKRKLRVRMMNVRDGRTGRMAGAGFIQRQMKGRRKVPQGSAIAIPKIGPGLRRLKSGSIPPGKKAKNRTDLVKIGKALYERQKRKGLVQRYVLASSAGPSSKGRFKYIEVGTRVIQRNFVKNWQRQMQRAVRTAR